MDIKDIKQHLTLANVLHYYNLKGDKQNRICCPFHEDKTPSMQLYYKTHTCYCFSSNCKTHGKSLDVIDFVMLKENINKHEAILKAQQIIGAQPEKPVSKQYEPLQQAIQPNASRETILNFIFTYFKNAIHNSTPARDYLSSRGLDPTKIEIGYNTGQFHHGARRDEQLISNCVSVGLLHPWGVNNKKPELQAYKPFAKYGICFALRNKANQVTSLYFRSSVDDNNAKHYYLKDSAGLYPKYPNPDTTKLIITESIIDCASLLQIESIVKEYTLLTAYGTNRLNDEIKAAIKELSNLKEIIFAFDNDDAGRKAATKYAEELKNELPNIITTTIELPCKDVNETLVAHSEDIFLHLLENRTFLFSTESAEPPKVINHSIENKKTIATPLEKLDGLNTNNANKLQYTTETATYLVLGGVSKQLDNLKIMLSIENKEGLKSRNKVDLYEDKQIEKLSKEVAEKLELRKDLLENDLYKLTDLLEQYRDSTAEPVATPSEEPTHHTFTLKERTELENFLKQPKVIRRLNDLLEKTGIVGERGNRIFLLLIALSYKMKDPLHALIQGSSGSGKTKLVRQISDCMPQEYVTRFTRISDKALYNYPKNYFTNRLLIIEDVDGLSEEAELAFRELQSSGELRSSVSIKLENGSITGGEKVVNGPIASMSCTTKGEIYEDNMSRVFLIAVDESQEQTKKIIEYQNRKASGSINTQEEKRTTAFVQNLIRIIEAKEVVNPYAEKIQLPEEAHKIRRLNDLFHNFIKMATVVNQYQRKKTEQGKLIAEIEDIETAIEIMFESIVLKVDELDGSLRQFYERLKAFIQKNYKGNHSKVEFTQREIRQGLNISKAQINRYLHNLVSLEYLYSNGFSNRGFKYQIAYWDNYDTIRKKIKEKLSQQIANIKE